MGGALVNSEDPLRLMTAYNSAFVAPRHPTSLMGSPHHPEQNLSKKDTTWCFLSSQIWSWDTVPSLNTTSPITLTSSGQSASLSLPFVYASQHGQTALCCVTWASWDSMTLQEVLLKCLSLGSNKKHLSPSLPTNKQKVLSHLILSKLF